MAAPATSSGTVGAEMLIPTRPVVVNAVFVAAPEFTIAAPVISNATVGATFDPILTELRNIVLPVTSSGAVGDAVIIPTFPVVVKVELTFTSPVTSSVAVGAAMLIPIRPVVVNAVLVVDAAVTRA